jgi:RNA polymerase sigma factor (sigma-70 family)
LGGGPGAQGQDREEAGQRRGIPVEDTEEFSIACEALLRAIEKYDPSSGYKFSTFATYCMRNAFVSLNRKQKRSVPLQMVYQKTIEAVTEKENCTDEFDKSALLQSILTNAEEKDSDRLDKEMMLQYYLEQKTLEEIGKIYGFSKMRAQQRIARAVMKIQKKLSGD